MRLHEEGLIYRGKRLVNWDPVLHTALSDLEVVAKRKHGSLVALPLSAERWHRTHSSVATTRPETMLGDTAVAVHPDDERYRHLIGKQVRLPLTEREIPIIADDYVDPEFGTGCVKITPAHDFNDYEVGQRHCLPLINILTPSAKINDNAPAEVSRPRPLRGTQALVADLEALGAGRDDRAAQVAWCRAAIAAAVIEPMLTDQWFVRHRAAGRARRVDAVEDGPHPLRARELVRRPISNGWTTSRTGASAASSGGAIRSRRGTTRTATSSSRATKPRLAQQARALRPRRALRAGRRRARHVVLVRAVAVLDARLAGRDAGAEDVLSDATCW